MKISIACFAAVAAFAVVASATPTVQGDKEQVLAYAQSIFKFGQDLLKAFPHVPQNQTIQQIVERIDQQIQELKVYNMNHVVDTVLNFAGYQKMLKQIEQQLRNPQNDDRSKVLAFAMNKLANAEKLLKQYPNEPEAKEIKLIIVDIMAEIKDIEIHSQLVNIIETIGRLVTKQKQLDNVAQRIAANHQHHY